MVVADRSACAVSGGPRGDASGIRLSEAGSFLAIDRKANGGALSRLMTHTTSFFDFVLILVTAGALAIILTIMLYITLQPRRSRN
jgi:hypothetical protein